MKYRVLKQPSASSQKHTVEEIKRQNIYHESRLITCLPSPKWRVPFRETEENISFLIKLDYFRRIGLLSSRHLL
jgi:hypothetical protein